MRVIRKNRLWAQRRSRGLPEGDGLNRMNGTYLMFAEKDKGSIDPGKLADFAVITKNYSSCPDDKIKDIEALRTVVGGKVVYDRLP